MIRYLKYTVLFSMLLLSSCVDDEMEGGGDGADGCDDLSSYEYNPTTFDLEIPVGFPQMEIPADNPLTIDGVELGRFLFYDPILSRDSTMSCSSCHEPVNAFTDKFSVSTGVDGLAGTRSSMSLVNVGFYNKGLFWDGRVSTLEEQAALPVEDPIELHDDWFNVEEKLIRSTFYPEMFRKAFGINDACEITQKLATNALAQFERTLISGNSEFDKVFYQNQGWLGDDEANGYDMFFDFTPEVVDAECSHCHNSPLFTSNDYFNNGLDSVSTLNDFEDLGRGEVTNVLFDNGKFRAPSLRNIELTAPYMHDGRFETLEEVIEHYNSGGHVADNLDPLINPLGLTNEEKNQLLLFLKTLTDTSFVNNPAFSNPF